MLKKYRKRPVVIEAVLLENTYDSIYEAVEFVWGIGMETSVIGANATVRSIQEARGLDIRTLEGNLHVNFDEYVVKDASGEFFRCKADSFEKDYEKVEA